MYSLRKKVGELSGRFSLCDFFNFGGLKKVDSTFQKVGALSGLGYPLAMLLKDTKSKKVTKSNISNGQNENNTFLYAV